MVNWKSYLSKIIGRQITRIDFARGYFSIIMTVFTALSMFSIYLSTIDITITLSDYGVLMTIAMFVFWVFGYVLDKMKILDAGQDLRNEKVVSATRNLWENAIIPPLAKMLDELIDKKLKEE